MQISLRDLQIEDAKVSWVWRNDPDVWKLTGRKWNNKVTREIEEDWIATVSKRSDEKRFAICVGEEKIYVGNVQLTNITQRDAVFHLFIGDKNYWGKGIATIATKLLLNYAFRILKLEEVKLRVKIHNLAAVKVYEKVGFSISDIILDDYLMKITNVYRE